MTTLIPHPTEVPAVVDNIESRILADAKAYELARHDDIRHLADEVLHGNYATTHLTMLRPLVDESWSDDDVALMFAGLLELVRTSNEVDAQRGGDSTRIDDLIDIRIDRLLGSDLFIVCVSCGRREDRELAQQCDGVDLCSTDCHSAWHHSACPAGDF